MSVGTYVLDTKELWCFDEESNGFKLCGYIAIKNYFEDDGVAIISYIPSCNSDIALDEFYKIQKQGGWTLRTAEEEIKNDFAQLINSLKILGFDVDWFSTDIKPYKIVGSIIEYNYDKIKYKLLQDYLLLKIEQFKNRKEGEKSK